MSKIAYSTFSSPWWKKWSVILDNLPEQDFWDKYAILAKEANTKPAVEAARAMSCPYAVYLYRFHRCPHYFVAPGVADFCISSVKDFGPDYYHPLPAPEVMAMNKYPKAGGMFLHFPASEHIASLLIVPNWEAPWRGEAILFGMDSTGYQFMNCSSMDDGKCFLLLGGGGRGERIGRLVYGLSLYMDAFPDAIVPAADHSVHHLRHYKGEQRQIGRSPVMEHEERQARSPHWRRGHFRVLHSEKFTHKRGQAVFVKGTFVKGQAFDILDDAPPTTTEAHHD